MANENFSENHIIRAEQEERRLKLLIKKGKEILKKIKKGEQDIDVNWLPTEENDMNFNEDPVGRAQ